MFSYCINKTMLNENDIRIGDIVIPMKTYKYYAKLKIGWVTELFSTNGVVTVRGFTGTEWHEWELFISGLEKLC